MIGTGLEVQELIAEVQRLEPRVRVSEKTRDLGRWIEFRCWWAGYPGVADFRINVASIMLGVTPHVAAVGFAREVRLQLARLSRMVADLRAGSVSAEAAE